MVACMSSMFRPHIVGPMEGQCWCSPVWVECTCDNECGGVWGHSEVEIRPDTQPRMSVYTLPSSV